LQYTVTRHSTYHSSANNRLDNIHTKPRLVSWLLQEL